MRILVGDSWSEEYLDPAPTEVRPRLEVHRQVALVPVTDKYFVRDPNASMLFAYLKALGPRRVLRKVLSRRSEARRNDAWVSVGVGTVDGSDVLFLLTSAPRAVTRTVVSAGLTWPWPADRPLPQRGHLVPVGKGPGPSVPDAVIAEVADLGGWSDEFGGVTVSPAAVVALLDLVAAPSPKGFVRTATAPLDGEPRERIEHPRSRERVGFTCFGYGQYAKTQAIANLSRYIELDCVHEIDPLQFGPIPTDDTAGDAISWDTSAEPRVDERIDNAVLAGYHHTHAPVAVQLLDGGTRHVVIEKPLATSFEQLDELLSAMERNPDSKVHAAFQRRHAPFNARLRSDLGGGPISLSATVYEVPLPRFHWYRWPVVGNSVVSNGCHWIDYFLFVNDFEPVASHHAMVFERHVVVALELTNGASGVISLRHEGSPRLGVRDVCTFWKGDVTVTIEDNSTYRAERGFKVSRTQRCGRLQAHEDMYVEFGRRIAADLAGDSASSIDVSTRAMLELAALVDQRGGTSMARW